MPVRNKQKPKLGSPRLSTTKFAGNYFAVVLPWRDTFVKGIASTAQEALQRARSLAGMRPQD